MSNPSNGTKMLCLKYQNGWSRRLNGPYGHINVSRSPVPLWTTHVHPEGAKYFFRKEDRWTIVTDANITHTPTSTAIQHSIDGLVALQQTIAQTEEMFHPNDVDLILDIVPDKSGHVVCKYYLTYHPMRVIFWLESVTPSQSLVFKMKVEGQYWHHQALYPGIACPSQNLLEELRDQICHGIGNSLISPMSMTAYAPEELRTMLEVLPTEVTELTNAPGCCHIMFILLKHFAEEKLANFHGEPSVRLNRGTSIYTDNPRTISHSFRMLNILLFYASGRHLRTIEYLTCDGMISRCTWKEFSAGVQKSCSDLSVYCQMIQGFRNTSGTFENMAVVHSLPYGCLYWRTFFFFAVFLMFGLYPGPTSNRYGALLWTSGYNFFIAQGPPPYTWGKLPTLSELN
ncbi:hypothetical protein EDD85DRAFT_791806 [Armillaria nabsnona]|nr:hypothetical protein EDD85DRAFT_791806 [Armillaria nabsnona]